MPPHVTFALLVPRLSNDWLGLAFRESNSKLGGLSSLGESQERQCPPALQVYPITEDGKSQNLSASKKKQKKNWYCNKSDKTDQQD